MLEVSPDLFWGESDFVNTLEFIFSWFQNNREYHCDFRAIKWSLQSAEGLMLSEKTNAWIHPSNQKLIAWRMHPVS